MTAERLEVRLFDRLAGELTLSGEMRSPEDWRFTYDEAYRVSSGVPLSVALPLQADAFVGARVRNWFSNLLPEGSVRDAIAARLRVPPRDDFDLLAAIGGECAGAVSVGAVDTDEPSRQAPLELGALLAAHGTAGGEGIWALLGTPRRLSLAGAQDKIAVVRGADGALHMPAAGELSTHILKPDSATLRGLRDLEALGLALARAAGLDVVAAQLREVAGRKALLIERYDRIVDGDGITQRLHQEDFCQALGFPGELKYESQGGPSLADCAELVRGRLRLGPVAVRGVLDWVAFNAAIGNADAHAKNLALLIGRDGRRRLAPFYDLVPTIAIAESQVDRTPALRIGGAARIDCISADDWRMFAAAAGYAPRFVLDRVATLAQAVAALVHATAQTLVAHGADAHRMQRAASIVETNARATAEAARAIRT